MFFRKLFYSANIDQNSSKMFTCVQAALEDCGLKDRYLKAFKENAVDDSVVVQCLQNPQDLDKVIGRIVPVLGHRYKFVSSFRNTEAAEAPKSEAFGIIKTHYNQEMEKIFVSSETFLQQNELLQHHKDISRDAIKLVADLHPNRSLTSVEQIQYEKWVKMMFKKYEEQNKMRRPMSTYAIGIDLGTTNSCVAVYFHGQVQVIQNDDGNNTTPSCVSFESHGSRIVGEAARELSHRNPKNTIFDIKRLIGRTFDDPNVKKSIKSWPFTIVNCGGQPKVQIVLDDESDDFSSDRENSSSKNYFIRNKRLRHNENCKEYHPEEISALVLKKMKKIAEDFLEAKVEACVITVPALFNDSQRQATKDAGAIAGLKVLKILNEPTSAAIAYNLHRLDDIQRNVLVFDLGGGTFDVSVLKIVGGKIKVEAVHGDNHLGGGSFDETMVNYCIKWFEKKYNVDLTRGREEGNVKERTGAGIRLRRIRNECEKQKKVLSTTQQTYICVDGIDSDHPKFVLDVPVTRELFNTLNQHYFDQCIEIVEEVLVDAEMDKAEIDDIVLVGGSTRIPKIQEMLSTFFDGKSLCKSINPDEAVAVGAAVQACILNEEDVKCNRLTLSDVNPLSIGLEDGRTGRMTVWIKKNTTIPCQFTSNWCPISDYQTSIFFKVYEGEDRIASRNNQLGEFELEGIPSDKAWKEEVRVTMSISDEGILSITAICKSNGVSTDLTITAYKNRLTIRDIETARTRSLTQ